MGIAMKSKVLILVFIILAIGVFIATKLMLLLRPLVIDPVLISLGFFAELVNICDCVVHVFDNSAAFIKLAVNQLHVLGVFFKCQTDFHDDVLATQADLGPPVPIVVMVLW